MQGGGKVRDPCVRRAGWLGRAQGGLGCALGAPRVDLVRLAFASRTERMKVTSTPEVPGPSRSWSPAPAAPSIPRDLRTSGRVRAPRGGDMCVRGTAQKVGFASHASHDGFICIEVYRSTDLKKVLSEAGSSAPDHPFFVRKMRCEGTLLV